jgi:hypothetical protein
MSGIRAKKAKMRRSNSDWSKKSDRDQISLIIAPFIHLTNATPASRVSSTHTGVSK